jgi:hypothetical protein
MIGWFALAGTQRSALKMQQGSECHAMLTQRTVQGLTCSIQR